MKRDSNLKIIFAFILLLAVTISDITFNLGIGRQVSAFLRPVRIVVSDVGLGVYNFFDNFRNIGNLQKENQDLTDKLNKALAEIAVLNEAQKENASLKRDLNFKQETDFELVSAHVISFDPANIRETVTLGVGTDDGITEGDIVISEGFLVGKILSTTNHTARVKLISDPASTIAASISSSSVSGVVKGRIGNGLSLEQIPQSEKVNNNDIVVTSGLGGDFPKGIIIGQVEEIQNVSGSIFQTISLRAMADLNKLERVMVIKK